MEGPLILIIMDGFGIRESSQGNAIKAASTPELDALFSKYPTIKIGASGEDVGLPNGQMGNSEVGHTNIGAGRIVYQDLTRISKTIKDGNFFKNEGLTSAMRAVKENNSSLHLMGLLSDGGVHSHVEHLYALLDMAKSFGLDKVYVHAFLDGRDTPPTSGINYISKCEDYMKKMGVGKIATVMGRYFAMDRDNRWERVKKAYDAIVLGKGEKNKDAQQAIMESYRNNVTDEFVEPIVCLDNANIKNGDSIVFFNFRPDRARELTRSITQKSFSEFERKDVLHDIHFVCMTIYDETFKDIDIAFKPEKIINTFGEYISNKGLKQLRIAETEKYAHVTFFFNGGEEKELKGEDRILVPSPKVATYDLKPQMSAVEVTENVLKNLCKYDVIILNYANCDMVGHTGNFDAAVKAVETVDGCVKSVVDKVLKLNGCAIITADHGNADKMIDEDGRPFTAHTTSLVPFCVVGHECSLKRSGRLADIAPTMLEILGLEKPKEMLGESLIKKKKTL